MVTGSLAGLGLRQTGEHHRPQHLTAVSTNAISNPTVLRTPTCRIALRLRTP